MWEVGGNDFEAPKLLTPNQQVVSEITADNCLNAAKEAVGT